MPPRPRTLTISNPGTAPGPAESPGGRATDCGRVVRADVDGPACCAVVTPESIRGGVIGVSSGRAGIGRVGGRVADRAGPLSRGPCVIATAGHPGDDGR